MSVLTVVPCLSSRALAALAGQKSTLKSTNVTNTSESKKRRRTVDDYVFQGPLVLPTTRTKRLTVATVAATSVALVDPTTPSRASTPRPRPTTTRPNNKQKTRQQRQPHRRKMLRDPQPTAGVAQQTQQWGAELGAPLSTLAAATVRPATQQTYLNALMAFRSWLRVDCLDQE